MPAQHGLGADQEEVASPIPLDAVEEKPEELVSGAEARPELVTEGDLELLAEDQVLEEEALAAAQGVDERGQEEPEEFDHRGRIADRHHLAGRPQTYAPLQLVKHGAQTILAQYRFAHLGKAPDR